MGACGSASRVGGEVAIWEAGEEAHRPTTSAQPARSLWLWDSFIVGLAVFLYPVIMCAHLPVAHRAVFLYPCIMCAGTREGSYSNNPG
jgi:hypothetical protein